MPYILSPQDTEKINFLTATGGRVLRQLHVPFNKSYLKRKLVLAWHIVFDLEAGDREDAANLAIVLLNALAGYHIKSNVVENYEQGSTVLVILAAKENTSYSELISLNNNVEAEHYILLERSPLSGEPDYQKRFWAKQLQLLLGIALVLTMAVLVTMAIWNGLQLTLSWIFPMVILSAGLYITYDLFQLERNNIKNDYLVKKLCANNGKTLNCQKVLSSKAAKIAGVISMTDIGVVYFYSIFFFLVYNLIQHTYVANMGVFLLASIIPLPYVVFSVYYQLKVVKKVCVLCMLTQMLLVLQFIFFMIAGNFDFTIPAIGTLILITVLVTLLYFLYVTSNNQKTELTRLRTEDYVQKSDTEFFSLMLHREPCYTEPYLDGMIQLGNPDAGLKMTAFLSLSCKPCANMLNILIKMADWFSDQLFINIMVMPDERSKELLQTIYYYTLKNDHAKALEILVASYNNQMPEVFANDNRAACRNLLYQHVRWLQAHPVSHTPTVVYEGHSIPPAWHDEALIRNILTRAVETIDASE